MQATVHTLPPAAPLPASTASSRPQRRARRRGLASNCATDHSTEGLAGTAAAQQAAAAPGAGAAAAAAARPPSAHMPLMNAVLERGGRSADVPFHVPGHKRGSSVPPGLDQVLGGALQYDLTELDGLDVLSSPSGPILAAQQAAAETWGADASWFLVNGTTCGIHAAVLATCSPGQALVLARNAHLSAFNAMVLAGCTPVYAQPSYDPHLGLAHAITPAALQAAFDAAAAAGLRVGAALVVSPTYFGVLSNVAALAAICHSHGVPLLVDEAHGAHLGLHQALPPSALQAGADLAIQSTHKQLSALTQAAMLHVRGPRVPKERISRALQVLQSSSPSYLLTSSLDAARAQAADPAAHAASVEAAVLARQQLAALPGVRLLSAAQAAACSSERDASDITSSSSSSASGIALDPLRLTLDLRQLGLTGFKAAQVLEQQYGIVPELATPTCVVLALSIGSTVQHAEALVAAVDQMCRRHHASASSGGGKSSSGSSSSSEGLRAAAGVAAPVLIASEVRLSPRDAFFAAAEAVPAEQAVGRMSAELLCPYPPGVPAAYPGEVLTAAVLQQLREVMRSGGTITGCSDGSLATLRVVVE